MLLQGHYEADISSCFHTVIRCFAGSLYNPLLAPLQDALGFIGANISGNADLSVVPKTILQRIITAPPHSVCAQIRRDFGVELGPELMLEIGRFHNLHKDLIVDAMKKKGFVGNNNSVRITDSNKLYFPCEAAETSVMTRALQKVLKHNNAESIVWLHDGMYINEQVPQSFTANAIVDAAQELGIDGVTVKITHCCNVKHDDYAYQNCETLDKRTSIVQEIINLANAQSNSNVCNGLNNAKYSVNLDKPLGKIRSILVI